MQAHSLPLRWNSVPPAFIDGVLARMTLLRRPMSGGATAAQRQHAPRLARKKKTPRRRLK
jgi:hypothetical protein